MPRAKTKKELFPDLYPTVDNLEIYQSFLSHYQIGLLLSSVLELKYYQTLFPAMEHIRNTLKKEEDLFSE